MVRERYVAIKKSVLDRHPHYGYSNEGEFRNRILEKVDLLYRRPEIFSIVPAMSVKPLARERLPEEVARRGLRRLRRAHCLPVGFPRGLIPYSVRWPYAQALYRLETWLAPVSEGCIQEANASSATMPQPMPLSRQKHSLAKRAIKSVVDLLNASHGYACVPPARDLRRLPKQWRAVRMRVDIYLANYDRNRVPGQNNILYIRNYVETPVQ